MKKFAFRLRKIRALRHQQEDSARLALAGAVTRLSQAETRLAGMAAVAEECRGQANAAPAVAVLATALLRGLERAAVRARTDRDAAAIGVAEARETWRQRRTAAAAMDKMYEARRRTWQLEVSRAEQGELEESARIARLLARRRGTAGATTDDTADGDSGAGGEAR
ncbi:MAG: hypothetical protein R3F56_24885 [Planctomycetota bacterium]